ncbi:MAG: repressor LexA [Acidobacteria bacterium]|nr:repressor LexA [Acidobacteriota bacterium]
MELTRKQRQLMDCVRRLMAETGVFPTLRELADCMEIRSVSTVHAHIRNLREKGVALMPVADVVKAPGSRISIPLFGWVVAGLPSDVCGFQENIEVPAALVPNPARTYALRITGDSMIDEHICEGDMVIVEKRDSARDGDIVIALVNGSETTVKRFRKEGDMAVLVPANRAMAPIRVPLENIEIQGVVVGVVRKY